MSAAFLEYHTLSKFRNDLDQVIGLRLISSLLPEIKKWPSLSFQDKLTLRRPNTIFCLDLHGKQDVKLDSFYRTYLFLRLIQDPMNLSYLNEDEIRYTFDNTVALDALLLERELKTMHLNVSKETRALVSVLALALYRGRSSDPDIDFDYRMKLEDYIVENFNGNVNNFIKSLAEESPQIANYLATSLDESTLQKMYTLVQSPEQGSLMRRDVLQTIGFALNRIEYIIEAEAIETRNQVSKLKKILRHE